MSKNSKKTTAKTNPKEFSVEERVKIVLEGMTGNASVSDLCRSNDISKKVYDHWVKDFVKGGRNELKRLAEKSTRSIVDEPELLREVVTQFPSNLLISRLEDGKVLYRSPSSQARFGNPKRTSNQWVDQNARAEFLKKLKRDLHVENVPMRALAADGSEFQTQFSSRLIEHDGEQIVISASTDLSEAQSLRQELEQANARFNEALEAFDEGFVLWDSDMKLVLENQSMFDMLYPTTPPPRIAQPGDDFDHVVTEQFANGVYKKPDGIPVEQVISIWAQMVKAHTKDLDIELCDGRTLSGSSHKTSHGGYLLTFKDVTEQRRAEKAETDANKLLRDAIEALDEGIMLYDSDLRLELYNNKASEMFFEGNGAFKIGATFFDICQHFATTGMLVMPEGLDKADWARFAEKDVLSYAKNTELTTNEGRLILATSHKSGRGGYLLTFKEVTEQRRAEIAEREANTLLKTIVEACPTTFLVSRVHDGKIIYSPPASRDRFGEIESTIEFYQNPQDRKDYLGALLPKGVLDDYPVEFVRGDGTVMQGLTSARVTDYNGEDVIVSSTRDITEYLAMQEELERERNRAHQNEKLSALGELLAGVAHELNNPLSIVVGYALMLQDKIEDPSQKQRIERVGQAAERCAKIVKMFLAMARQSPLELVNCSVNEILEAVIDAVGPNLEASGIGLKVDLGVNIPMVEVDPDQLAQVFTNLILNAEHVLSNKTKGGRIKVITRYEKKRNEVVVKIRDNGEGIPKAIQRRIFEPFFTTKGPGIGTGVGLALSHRIVNSHNGVLSVHSVEEKGATFFVRLKAVADFVDLQTLPVEEQEQSGRLSICLVDDEVGVTELMRDILEEAGHQVDVQNDPVNALAQVASKKFDIILCDMKMAGIDGREFYRRVVENDPTCASNFAFVTGDTMSPQVANFLISTSVPYLEKPIVPKDLIALVAKTLKNRNGKPRGGNDHD